MNMACRFPIIYWNCANLLVMASAVDGIDDTTDYGSIATAVSDMQYQGVDIVHP